MQVVTLYVCPSHLPPPLSCCLCRFSSLQVDTLYAGEVGYLAAQIKSVQDARVGDTVTLKKSPAAAALEGYEDVQPMVYCGLFPTDADDYQVGKSGCLLRDCVQPIL
jgi:translation elongation factor EF-4